MRRQALLGLLIIAGLAVGASCDKGDAADGGVAAVSATVAPTAPVSSALQVLTGVQMAPVSFAPIAKAADPSVVTVNVVVEQIVETWSGRKARREGKGLGTGFIIDKDGTIITNNHVVSEGGNEAQVISVKLADGKELPAHIVGRDQATDIAILHIDPKGLELKALTLGDSDAAEVGDWVVAIGNPFGLEHTVSQGIVSAKGRTKEEVPLDPSGFYDFIQTDASINPGNSGGPLLNLKCEVVGINAAIHGPTSQGIGFAIPINMVKQLLPMLLRDGKVVRSALGVQIKDARELTEEDKKELKIEGDKGTVVEYVTAGGPADQGGVKVGDVITAFDNKPIERGKQLQWMASTTGVGKTVSVHVTRAGKPSDLKVTLGSLQPSAPRPR